MVQLVVIWQLNHIYEFIQETTEQFAEFALNPILKSAFSKDYCYNSLNIFRILTSKSTSIKLQQAQLPIKVKRQLLQAKTPQLSTIKQSHILAMTNFNKDCSDRFKYNTFCINPSCISETRFCSVAVEDQVYKILNRDHLSCRGWLMALTEHQFSYAFSEANVQQQAQVIDFLKHPFIAIEQLTVFSNGNWKQEISSLFNGIRANINQKLREQQLSIYDKIQAQLSTIINIRYNISELRSQLKTEHWTAAQSQFYEQLLDDLQRIKPIGILSILNTQMLNQHLFKIQHQIANIQSCFWVQESRLSQSQRVAQYLCTEKLAHLAITRDMDLINQYLQDIQRELGIKPFSYKDSQNNQIYIQCGLCNLKIQPELKSKKGKFKHTKKAVCKLGLFLHFCHQHTQEVLEKYVRKETTTRYRLEFNQLVEQVALSSAKNLVIIDRKHSTATDEVLKDRENYVIEVVSKKHEGLPTGKYIVADSVAKDAADVLIIVLLCELARLTPKRNIWLVTQGQYAPTLQSIYSSLGISIHLLTKKTADSPLHSKIMDQTAQDAPVEFELGC